MHRNPSPLACSRELHHGEEKSGEADEKSPGEKRTHRPPDRRGARGGGAGVVGGGAGGGDRRAGRPGRLRHRQPDRRPSEGAHPRLRDPQQRRAGAAGHAHGEQGDGEERKYTNILMGTVQAAIAHGVLDAVRAGDIPKTRSTTWDHRVGMARPERRPRDDRSEHPLSNEPRGHGEGIHKAMHHEPGIDWLLKNRSGVQHYFHQLALESTPAE